MDRTVSCLVSLALVLLTTAALAAPPPAVTPALLAQGKALYEKQCAVCHGTEGKGNGPAADFLFPKPRDFTSGVFKLRSTPLGEPPTDADLFRTLTRGLPGSAMPGFAFLSETERWALVAYVKQLASIKVPPEEVVAIPPETPATLASIERGRKIYFEAGCDQCHGPEGRGDGPQAKELEDDWGTPIFPANLPLARFKGGGTPQDLYRTLATGVDGTPMPAVEGLPPEQIWDLVHYVRYLTGGKIVKQPDGTAMLEAKRLQGPLPAQPLDPRWETVPATTIPLMDLWQFPDKPLEAVTVRAAHDGASLVLLLTWKDYSAAPDALRHQDFADGAAVQWSLTPEPPHFTMGEPGHPVNIWFWRYDFQRDLAEHQDLEHVYPGMAVDWYPYQRAKAGVVGPTAAQDPTYITGWGVGSPMSQVFRRSAVQDLNAMRFGSLTAQLPYQQDVSGMGIWVDGEWRVVFRRSLRTGDKNDMQLTPGTTVPVAFAIFDGSRQDRDGQKAITLWNRLYLAP